MHGSYNWKLTANNNEETTYRLIMEMRYHYH
nr:MAG TPA: hypothetical protein [Caudoviricetes sp.]